MPGLPFTNIKLETFVINNLDAETKHLDIEAPAFICGYSLPNWIIVGFNEVFWGWDKVASDDIILSEYKSYLYMETRDSLETILKSTSHDGN